MFSSSKLSKALLFVLIALIVIVALPDSFKTWAPSFLRPTVHYGLDLAGGTQLDFRISEQELNEQIAVIETKILTAQGEEKIRLQNDLAAIRKQKENVVEAIRTVLERRINSLGVSEARITPSQFGNENHLLVECPGVIDKQKCIDTVGKTIQLEFKEEFTAATAEYEQKIAAQADAVFAEITAGTKTITTASQDLTGDLAVQYQESLPVFEDQLPKELAQLWNRPVGAAPVKVNATVSQARQKSDGGFDIIEVPGVYIAEVVSPKTNTGRIIDSPVEAMKTLDAKQADIAFSDTKTVSVTSLEAGVQDKVKAATPNSFIDASSGDAQSIYYVQSVTPGEETMSVRQILVTYSGSFAGITGITRTKAEALVRAEEAAKAITGGADFAAIAKQYSDDSFAAAGGLQESVKRSEKDAAYANAAFTLPVGAVTPVIETPFGYYIVKAVTAATKAEDAVTFASLQITGADAASTKATSLAALQNKTVSVDAEQMNVRYLFFSKMPTGWKNTALDGKHFRSAVVTLDEFSRPVVQINFNEEGGKLFQQLTKDNIGKRIAIFVGGELVSAPMVNAEISGGTAVITGSSNIVEAQKLAQDLNTGAIPAPIYLSGQRTIEPTLGAAALHTSLKAALIGVIVLMVYMIVFYRLLGVVANVALLLYALLFYVLLKLPLGLISGQYIVLTIAGLAGIILSIGMAVDANVLIFERMKEEMRKGKMLSTAAEIGFKKAWPSIRDGNASTLITCAILFLIGTSVVRGFAITLSVGVLLSMFTAIVITQYLLGILYRSPLAKRPELFIRR